MVDIGLGPTYGFSYFELYATKGSPRHVQTDAYHRPCALNIQSFAFTSFFYSRQAVKVF